MGPFEDFITGDSQINLILLNSHNPYRSFSFRYQISAYPGLFYFTISNLTRGSILAPNLEVDDKDIQAIINLEKHSNTETTV